MSTIRQIDAAGEALIKSFEGLVLVAASDKVGKNAAHPHGGVPTVGWGHTGPDVKIGMRITEQDAENLFHIDMRSSEIAVTHLVHVPLTDNQFAALVSLVFNVGSTCLLSGTHLAQNLAAKDYTAAADNFLSWNHSGGAVVAGLTRRRQAERSLFLAG